MYKHPSTQTHTHTQIVQENIKKNNNSFRRWVKLKGKELNDNSRYKKKNADDKEQVEKFIRFVSFLLYAIIFMKLCLTFFYPNSPIYFWLEQPLLTELITGVVT